MEVATVGDIKNCIFVKLSFGLLCSLNIVFSRDL